MPKRTCCCEPCQWCDHDHYRIDRFSFDPLNPFVQQDAQPNWNSFGTLTTELPSVGHPMSVPTFIGCDPCPGDDNCGAGCCDDGGEVREGGLVTSPDNPLLQFPTFRSNPYDLSTTSRFWGNAFVYGDIQPCWFNGINMVNMNFGSSGSTSGDQPQVGNISISSNEEFLRFTFKLKIEKEVNGSYQTIVNISEYGPGLNLRPHPDACKSYNVNDSAEWALRSSCNSFFTAYDDDGNPLPCFRDFAKMPRGPWPYRFQRKLDVDELSEFCYDSNGIQYTAADVLKAQKAYDTGGTAAFNDFVGSVSQNGGVIEDYILDCTYQNGSCNAFDDPNCCSSIPYHNRDQLCNQLDITEGTPYGWEDCPAVCPKMSNYGSDAENSKFFGWISPLNRYTTPEWDLYSYPAGWTGYNPGVTGGDAVEVSEQSKRISLHVIVPNRFDDFCEPRTPGTQNYSFGEWSFGMDLEAPDEIFALEDAGYIWSNGVEDDGVWINKTPTGALRVLFTLDHSDINQGKVWRVFRDWNVKVENLVKTFNFTKPNKTNFRVTVEQKVEEVQFVSMGCDCPSGYTLDEDGNLIPREEACDPHLFTDDFGLVTDERPELTCWQSFIDGPFSPGSFSPSTNTGARISFSERGPIYLQSILETDETGCLLCLQNPATTPIFCSSKHGSRSSNTSNTNSLAGGQVYVINGPSVSRSNSIYTPQFGAWPSACPNLPACLNACFFGADGTIPQPYGIIKPDYPAAANAAVVLAKHGLRYNGAVADLPWAAGALGSVGSMRYRNVYNSVEVSPSAIQLSYQNWVDPLTNELLEEIWGYYSFLYGSWTCRWSGAGNCPKQDASGSQSVQDPVRGVDKFGYMYIDQWPSLAPIGNCKIACDTCGAREVFVPGITWDGGSGPPGISGYTPGNFTGFVDIDRCPCEQNPNPPEGNDANPETIGPYLFPYYRCGENVNRQNGLSDADYHYECDPYVWNGNFYQYCYDLDRDPFFNPGYFGIDSDRFYFSNDGQVSTRSFIGRKECAATCECPTSQTQSGGCRYTTIDENGLPVEKCDYCEGVASSFSIGFPRNSYFSWRKYLCRERTQGKPIDPNFMATLSWSCTDSVSCPENLAGFSCGCDCDYAWTRPNCDIQAAGYGNILNYAQMKCGLNKIYSNLNSKYRINFQKFEPTQDMADWNTTYEPNPLRGSLPANRSHVIITPKGLY